MLMTKVPHNSVRGMNLHVFQSPIPIYNATVWRKLGTGKPGH